MPRFDSGRCTRRRRSGTRHSPCLQRPAGFRLRYAALLPQEAATRRSEITCLAFRRAAFCGAPPAEAYRDASACGSVPRRCAAHWPAPYGSRRRDCSIGLYQTSGVPPALHNRSYVLRPGKPGNLKVYMTEVMQASRPLAGQVLFDVRSKKGGAIPVLSPFLQKGRAKTPPCQMESAVRYCHGSCIQGSATTLANAEPHRVASSQLVPVLLHPLLVRHVCCKTQATTAPDKSGRCSCSGVGSVNGVMSPMPPSPGLSNRLHKLRQADDASPPPSPSANEEPSSPAVMLFAVRQSVCLHPQAGSITPFSVAKTPPAGGREEENAKESASLPLMALVGASKITFLEGIAQEKPDCLFHIIDSTGTYFSFREAGLINI